MIKLLTYIGLIACTFTIFTYPYIAALSYAFFSLLQPQYIWHWVFNDFPIFKITAGIAIIAWFIAILKGNINWNVYRSGIMYSLLSMLIIFYISNIFSPFQIYVSAVSSDIVMGIFTTIVLMFIVLIGAINNQRALFYSILVLLGVVTYYAYWANIAYFSQEWFRFVNGRLEGPGRSPYKDGNVASVLFVIAMPFLILAFYEVKKYWLKSLIVLVLIFMLHSVILFASRGALLSIGVSMFLLAFIVKSRAFNVILFCGLVVFLIDQGGQLMTRTTSTVKLSQSNTTEPLNPRLVSWKVGVELTKRHPVLGVGPQRFLQASRSYFPGESPHVAHNTFLNFAANTGLMSGFLYLTIFYITYKNYRRNSTILSKFPNRFLSYTNKASLVSMVGFFTAALFLDLIIYEPFYYLLVIVVVTHHLIKQHGAENADKSYG